MSLSRINREVIIRVGLQAGDTHAVPRLVRTLSVLRLRDLAQIVRVSAIVHDGATPGVRRPGYDCPGIAHAGYTRSLGDLQVPSSALAIL